MPQRTRPASSRRLREASALAALAFAVAEFALGQSWARNFIPQLGFAALAVAILCGFSRLYIAGAAWLAAGALALAAVAPAYLPHHSAVRPGCTITVLNFNKEENPPDDAGAARLLSALRPDIVFGEKVYGAEHFAALLLAGSFAGYASFSAPGATLLLSRFPVIHTYVGGGGAAADVLVENRTVRLLNMYLTRPNLDRTGYLAGYDALYRQIAAQKGPLILAGDGNATTFAAPVKRLHTLMRDAWEERGFGLGATFPGPWRRAGMLGAWLRIDYIFHNDAFDTAAVRRVEDAAGAGHYPVWAKLVLVGAGRPGQPCTQMPHSAPPARAEKR